MKNEFFIHISAILCNQFLSSCTNFKSIVLAYAYIKKTQCIYVYVTPPKKNSPPPPAPHLPILLNFQSEVKSALVQVCIHFSDFRVSAHNYYREKCLISQVGINRQLRYACPSTPACPPASRPALYTHLLNTTTVI